MPSSAAAAACVCVPGVPPPATHSHHTPQRTSSGGRARPRAPPRSRGACGLASSNSSSGRTLCFTGLTGDVDARRTSGCGPRADGHWPSATSVKSEQNARTRTPWRASASRRQPSALQPRSPPPPACSATFRRPAHLQGFEQLARMALAISSWRQSIPIRSRGATALRCVPGCRPRASRGSTIRYRRTTNDDDSARRAEGLPPPRRAPSTRREALGPVHGPEPSPPVLVWSAQSACTIHDGTDRA